MTESAWRETPTPTLDHRTHVNTDQNGQHTLMSGPGVGTLGCPRKVDQEPFSWPERLMEMPMQAWVAQVSAAERKATAGRLSRAGARAGVRVRTSYDNGRLTIETSDVPGGYTVEAWDAVSCCWFPLPNGSKTSRRASLRFAEDLAEISVLATRVVTTTTGRTIAKWNREGERIIP